MATTDQGERERSESEGEALRVWRLATTELRPERSEGRGEPVRARGVAPGCCRLGSSRRGSA